MSDWTACDIRQPDVPGTYLAIRDCDHVAQWHFGHWNGTRWRSGDAGTVIHPTHWKELGETPSGDPAYQSEFTKPDNVQ